MHIDEKAPVSASGSIEIAASPREVWAVLTDIEGWPRWNPDVYEASMDGPLEAGTRFRRKAGTGTITSVLQIVVPEQKTVWSGTPMGVHARHGWRLEPTQWGTLLTSEESWRGWSARLMHWRMAEALRGATGIGLHHLKAEAELRSRVAALVPAA